MKTRPLRIFLALLFAASVLIAQDKPKTSGPSSVWVVEKDGHKLYLAGTIHLLREKDYPLPDVFEQAYRDSARMIFELPPDSEGNGEIVIRMKKLGTYPEGETLDEHLSADSMKRLQDWAEKRDYPMKAIVRYRPWFLSLTIAAIEYQALGAEQDRGLDNFFEKRAKEDGKPGAGLESVEYQLTLFSRLEPKVQEQLLMQTLEEAATMQKDFDEMAAAWRSGDSPRLQSLLYRDADKFPELMQEFLVNRNKAWIAPLMKQLESGDTAMVLVGAGHLGGKTGVLELLKEKGCTVRQLGKP